MVGWYTGGSTVSKMISNYLLVWELCLHNNTRKLQDNKKINFKHNFIFSRFRNLFTHTQFRSDDIITCNKAISNSVGQGYVLYGI